MPTVKVTPSKKHPIPFNTEDQKPSTFAEEVAVAGETAEALIALGASVEVAPEDAEREKKLLEAVVKNHKKDPLKNLTTAFAAKAFLTTYGQELALDVATVRSAITSKLMEIANCGETKYELKALELLGKHSDIGLFTERSEITINYRSPEELEEAIKERVKRLLNAEVIDITPIGMDLDEELGVVGMDDIKIEEAEAEKPEETPKPDMETIKKRVREINTPKNRKKPETGASKT